MNTDEMAVKPAQVQPGWQFTNVIKQQILTRLTLYKSKILQSVTIVWLLQM